MKSFLFKIYHKFCKWFDNPCFPGNSHLGDCHPEKISLKESSPPKAPSRENYPGDFHPECFSVKGEFPIQWILPTENNHLRVSFLY